MRAAAKWIVQDDDVARVQSKVLERVADRHRHRAQVHGHVVAHRQRLAIAVVDGAGVIAALFDIRRKRSSTKDDAHLVGDRQQRVPEEFQVNGSEFAAGGFRTGRRRHPNQGMSLQVRCGAPAAYAGMVWNWLRKRETAEPGTTLHGAPVKPRLKTYSAETGYVYQYVYRGHRSAPVPDGPRSKQYVFSVSRDRKNYFPVFVVLAEQVVSSWCAAHQRVLSETELYAIAKLSLFEALDQRRGSSRARCANRD